MCGVLSQVTLLQTAWDHCIMSVAPSPFLTHSPTPSAAPPYLPQSPSGRRPWHMHCDTGYPPWSNKLPQVLKTVTIMCSASPRLCHRNPWIRERYQTLNLFALIWDDEESSGDSIPPHIRSQAGYKRMDNGGVWFSARNSPGQSRSDVISV